jgi:hypothetical protein
MGLILTKYSYRAIGMAITQAELDIEVVRGETYLQTLQAVFGISGQGVELKVLPITAQRLLQYGEKARILGEAPTPAEVLPLVYLVLLGKFSAKNQPLENMELVLRSAFARSKIDRGVVSGTPDYSGLMTHFNIPENRLTLSEVASMARMNDIAVRNALNKKDPPFQFEKGEFAASAPIDKVRPWLEERKAYLATEYVAPIAKGMVTVSVPVARDGSIFNAQCQLPSGFRVGEKGREVKFDDIDEALAYLNGMKSPKWRRRNDKGVPGIVTGIDRREISREEFLKKS